MCRACTTTCGHERVRGRHATHTARRSGGFGRVVARRARSAGKRHDPISKRLGDLDPIRSRSRVKTRVVEFKNASEVSAALQYSKKRLEIAWIRLQDLDSRQQMTRLAKEFSTCFNRLDLREQKARLAADAAASIDKEEMRAHFANFANILKDQKKSLATIEKVLNLKDRQLSMSTVTAIVEEEQTPTQSRDRSSASSSAAPDAGHGMTQDQVGRVEPAASSDVPDFTFDYERERAKLEQLQPKLMRFWRRLERGEVGKHMSGEERKDLAALTQRLWMPWKLPHSRVERGRDFLGIGTFGIVFKGKLKLEGGTMKVAVKVMREAFVKDEFIADFFREASLLYRLRHPAIVTFYGAWWPEETSSQNSDSDDDEEGDAGKAVFVMERMDGHIGMLVESGKIGVRQDILWSFMHATEALRHVHKNGVLHLDVKPENILARTTHDDRLLGRAKLTDFGVSRRKQHSTASRSTRESERPTSGRGASTGIVGTLVYMAPEILLCHPMAQTGGAAGSRAAHDEPAQGQTNSGATYSFACDVYSLGMTMCRVMQLKMARDGKPIQSPQLFQESENELAAAARSGKLLKEVNQWVGAILADETALREIVLACVQTLPCNRPSLRAVLTALQECALSENGAVFEQQGARKRVADILEMDSKKTITLTSRSASSQSARTLQTLSDTNELGGGIVKDSTKKSAKNSEKSSAKNDAKKVEMYQRAVDGGDLVAAFRLGNMYRKGEDVAKDPAKACQLYQRASEGGHVGAAFNLGTMFHAGEGVPKNSAKARKFYQRAMIGGDLDAAVNLGVMYANGEGVARDSVKACQLYQRAVDGGHLGAAVNLAYMFRSGEGVAQDSAKACELYQRAVDGGHLGAAFNLGMMYKSGEGVPKNKAKAFELYQLAMGGGDLDEAANLGVVYAPGKGLVRDSGQGRELHRPAGEGVHGNSAAMRIRELDRHLYDFLGAGATRTVRTLALPRP